MADPRVAVGIINYHDYSHMPLCLDSVKRQSLRADRVILLDNQSSPHEIEKIARAYPEVDLLAMRENLGYSGGGNRIIREPAGMSMSCCSTPTPSLTLDVWRRWFASWNRLRVRAP